MAARVSTYTDYEDEDWTELLVEILLDTKDDERALAIWDEFGDKLDAALTALSDKDQERLASELGIHLVWGTDR